MLNLFSSFKKKKPIEGLGEEVSLGKLKIDPKELRDAINKTGAETKRRLEEQRSYESDEESIILDAPADSKTNQLNTSSSEEEDNTILPPEYKIAIMQAAQNTQSALELKRQVSNQSAIENAARNTTAALEARRQLREKSSVCK